jgi:hypothetical protein
MYAIRSGWNELCGSKRIVHTAALKRFRLRYVRLKQSDEYHGRQKCNRCCHQSGVRRIVALSTDQLSAR